MKKSHTSYSNLSDYDKKNIIDKLYVQEKQSFSDIAKQYNTYANKIRRDAKKFHINIRSKSEAQKNALETGKHKHPTKGTNRSEAIKGKIGNAVMKSWEKISEKEFDNRRKKSKQAWDNRNDDDKKNTLQKANEAVRMASKDGSKLEKFICKKLIADGYKVNFHHEHFLLDTKLQIDIFIPSINTAIEVDGPSHFSPVWGDHVLKRNQKYDNKKTGLILGKGMVLIRLKQTRDFAPTRAKLIYEKLSHALNKIQKQFPDQQDRYIFLED